MTRHNLLRQASLFAGLTDTELQTLALTLHRHTFAPGIIIFHRDAPGNTLYLVEAGRVRIFLLSDAGQEITLNFHGPGECFGELALLDGMARSAGAITLEHTVVYTLHRDDFLRHLRTHPHIAESILALLSRRLRAVVRSAIASETPRRLFWEQAMDGAVAELVLAGREQQAEQLLQRQLADSSALHRGEVYLLGAGPGDPDLMTFKALRLLQSADVVLYDRLVAPAIVELARRDAERIYVGKSRADHSLPQQQINALLLEMAQQGKRVVRLKGGDPFIFGRGGEEIELLARHHIPFQVVPGITAASAAACYAGIPLTHRDHAQSVRFVAGHLKNGSLDHDWTQFLSEKETLVFYMGLVGLPIICAELQRHGRAADTPIALVERASTAEQRVITGTLATMADIVQSQQPQAPTLIIIGSVVRLHESLAWFGERSG